MPAAIRLNGIECRCRIGVPPEERSSPQRIVLDLEFLQTSGTRFVDYAQAAKEAKSVAEEREFELVEELSEEIIERLSSLFMLDALTVRVHKWPAALPGVEVVAELERRKR